MNILKLPSEISSNTVGNECIIELYIAQDISYFDGHFSDLPVLPGVVQIGWAEHWGKEKLGIEGTFSAMEAIKFKQIIQPDTRLTLKLRYNRETGKLNFLFSNESGEKSSGRLVYK